MANNRMYLKCKECGESIAFAKFYPSGGFIAGDGSGWYSTFRGDLSKRMDEFYGKHMHHFDESTFGGHQYELVYETPLIEEKK